MADENVTRTTRRQAGATRAGRASAAVRAQVFQVPVKASRDVVKALEQLLAFAQAGDVTGIAFAATLRGGRYITDAAGECYDRPTFARGAIATLNDELSELIHQAHIDERR